MSTQLKVRLQITNELNHFYLLIVLVDDVFVRKDLYEGKYAPDMQAWEKFDEVMKQLLQISDEEEKSKIEEKINMNIEKEEL